MLGLVSESKVLSFVPDHSTLDDSKGMAMTAEVGEKVVSQRVAECYG